MIIEKFKGHEHANARMFYYTDGSISLISYREQVATISKDGWLQILGLFSMTTRKHIGWFMREYGATYQLAKTLYNNKLKMNIYTGEVLPC